jgi:ubiquinone/menaquinone biosynthesis C-methylase UbiE
MTVSISATSRKYRNKKAATYEAIRTKQARWHRENELVESMLTEWKRGARVLDVPVGTGRFLKLYQKKNFNITGYDISEDMLRLARKKKVKCNLHIGDARQLNELDKDFSVSVCVRFLDLIDEEAMRAVMKELFRVTDSQIILTIRFGAKYLPKSGTAEHDEKKFRAMVARAGWHIHRAEPIREAGWHVLSLLKKWTTKNGR